MHRAALLGRGCAAAAPRVARSGAAPLCTASGTDGSVRPPSAADGGGPLWHRDDASETRDYRSPSLPIGGHVLITCEHASNRLPAPYTWGANDVRTKVYDSHWGWDPGALAVARGLAARIGSVVVASRFSRLLVDPNRPISSGTLIRTECEGVTVGLNEGIEGNPRGVMERLHRYYTAYHLAMGRAAQRLLPRLIISIHSFTPLYEGEKRDIHVGVLHTAAHKDVAAMVAYQFAGAGWKTGLNTPYSGRDGFMFAADSLRCSLPVGEQPACVMVEFRQDKLQDAAWTEEAVAQLAKCVTRLPCVQDYMWPAARRGAKHGSHGPFTRDE